MHYTTHNLLVFANNRLFIFSVNESIFYVKKKKPLPHNCKSKILSQRALPGRHKTIDPYLALECDPEGLCFVIPVNTIKCVSSSTSKCSEVCETPGYHNKGKGRKGTIHTLQLLFKCFYAISKL